MNNSFIVILHIYINSSKIYILRYINTSTLIQSIGGYISITTPWKIMQIFHGLQFLN